MAHPSAQVPRTAQPATQVTRTAQSSAQVTRTAPPSAQATRTAQPCAQVALNYSKGRHWRRPFRDSRDLSGTTCGTAGRKAGLSCGRVSVCCRTIGRSIRALGCLRAAPFDAVFDAQEEVAFEKVFPSDSEDLKAKIAKRILGRRSCSKACFGSAPSR